jgi:hypothetical protein
VPVIQAPTPYAWIIGRIQTNGPADYDAVNAVQDGLKLTSMVPGPDHPIDPDLDTTTEALTIANRMSAVEFFSYAATALTTIPPHASDFSILARISRLGIVPGQPFSTDRFDQAERAEIQDGASAALQQMIASVPTMGTETEGWSNFANTVGVYGNAYLTRAGVTLAGLGANPPEDAIYRC